MTIKYSENHEWVRDDGNHNYTVGITDYAQEQLGDIVFVELPSIGNTIKKKDAVAVIESVKAASDVYAPMDGKITGINDALDANPETINGDAQGAGWLFTIHCIETEQFSALMSEAEYQDFMPS